MLMQNISTSPYLDPRLFAYSKHISPIVGLRNSPTEPLRFLLARRYEGLDGDWELAGTPAAGTEGQAAGARQQQQQQQGQQQRVVLQLEPAQPHSVVWGNEEVARRQLHLFHPTDPFVLTVVQTIAQPAVVSLCFRA